MLKRKDRNIILIGLTTWLGSILYSQISHWPKGQWDFVVDGLRSQGLEKDGSIEVAKFNLNQTSAVAQMKVSNLDDVVRKGTNCESLNLSTSKSKSTKAKTNVKINAKTKVNVSIADYKKVNVNTANLRELIKLKGVGEKTAARIIQFRELKGSISSLKELQEVKGLGKKKLNLLKDHITFN